MSITYGGKQEILSDLEKRVKDKIIEQSNFDLLKKLVEGAETLDEAMKIAALGTTYKRTGFHFDPRLEPMKTDTIAYFKKNDELSFATDNDAVTHKLIIGDNYPALLNLLIQYKEEIDVIYIDPPYGKDDLGNYAVVNYNNAITRDNLLSLLYPRLKLAKRLLCEEGVIFCSIDDKNHAYVKCLFDEVFGEANFVASFPRVTNQSGKTPDAIAKNHDYVLLYSKAYDTIADINLEKHDDEGYCNKDEFFEERGFFKLNQTLDYDSLSYSPSLDYPITLDGKTYYPGSSKEEHEKRLRGNHFRADWAWRWSRDLFKFGLDNGFVVVKESKNGSGGRIYTKTYQNVTIKKTNGDYRIVKIDRTKNLSSLAFVDNMYSNDNAKKNTVSVLGRNVFDYTKPVKLIKDLCSFYISGSGVVLDFFAGSGTTGQAVLELNAEDGDRALQFILVTNNEQTKATPNGIAYDATSKRLKRVMTGECYDGTKGFEWADTNKPLGGNLDVYDMAEVADSADAPGKTPFDVIDETLYGRDKLEIIRDKVEWVCENFDIARKKLPETETEGE
jgi:adenine-specific DNA-methyltransferase